MSWPNLSKLGMSLKQLSEQGETIGTVIEVRDTNATQSQRKLLADCGFNYLGMVARAEAGHTAPAKWHAFSIGLSVFKASDLRKWVPAFNASMIDANAKPVVIDQYELLEAIAICEGIPLSSPTFRNEDIPFYVESAMQESMVSK